MLKHIISKSLLSNELYSSYEINELPRKNLLFRELRERFTPSNTQQVCIPLYKIVQENLPSIVDMISTISKNSSLQILVKSDSLLLADLAVSIGRSFRLSYLVQVNSSEPISPQISLLMALQKYECRTAVEFSNMRAFEYHLAKNSPFLQKVEFIHLFCKEEIESLQNMYLSNFQNTAIKKIFISLPLDLKPEQDAFFKAYAVKTISY